MPWTPFEKETTMGSATPSSGLRLRDIDITESLAQAGIGPFGQLLAKQQEKAAAQNKQTALTFLKQKLAPLGVVDVSEGRWLPEEAAKEFTLWFTTRRVPSLNKTLTVKLYSRDLESD